MRNLGEGDTARNEAPTVPPRYAAKAHFFWLMCAAECAMFLAHGCRKTGALPCVTQPQNVRCFTGKKWRIDAASGAPRLICAVQRTSKTAFSPLTAHLVPPVYGHKRRCRLIWEPERRRGEKEHKGG